jgi:hypothetical protein
LKVEIDGIETGTDLLDAAHNVLLRQNYPTAVKVDVGPGRGSGVLVTGTTNGVLVGGTRVGLGLGFGVGVGGMGVQVGSGADVHVGTGGTITATVGFGVGFGVGFLCGLGVAVGVGVDVADALPVSAFVAKYDARAIPMTSASAPVISHMRRH